MATEIEHDPPPERPADMASTAPKTLREYVGQQQVIPQLETALAAHRRDIADGRPQQFAHIAMFGPPGLGKTALASIIAAELGVTLREMLGQSLANPQAMNALLIDAKDTEMVLIDEADELPQESQSAMLRAIEERVLLLPTGRAGQVTRVPLAPFTIIVASNRPHGLLAALRDRLQLVLHFDFYTTGELAILCQLRAESLGWPVGNAVLTRISRCARGVPRQALRLLASCRRTARAAGADEITEEHFLRTCELESVEETLGLDKHEMAYLRILNDAHDGMRPSVMAAKLGLPMRQVTEVTESFLARIGLILRIESKRYLTNFGVAFCRARLDGEQQ